MTCKACDLCSEWDNADVPALYSFLISCSGCVVLTSLMVSVAVPDLLTGEDLWVAICKVHEPSISGISMITYCNKVTAGTGFEHVGRHQPPIWSRLLVSVIVKDSVLAKWLARKTRWGSLTVARGSSPQSPGRKVFDFLGSVYCFLLLWCGGFLVPRPAW